MATYLPGTEPPITRRVGVEGAVFSRLRGRDAPSTRGGLLADEPWAGAHEVVDPAVTRERLRRHVAAALGGLSHADRVAVLLDLLAEAATGNDVEPHAATRGADLAEAEAPLEGVRNRSALLVATLAARPRTPTAELAELAYGSRARKHRDRVRGLLAALRKRGLVRSVAPGVWEAVPGPHAQADARRG